jgi:hypothetical protein
VLNGVEQMTGSRTKACLVAKNLFEQNLSRSLQSPPTNELTFDDLQGVSKITRALCDYGSLLNANKVSIGRCSGYLWARMKAPSGLSDVLFRVA